MGLLIRLILIAVIVYIVSRSLRAMLAQRSSANTKANGAGSSDDPVASGKDPYQILGVSVAADQEEIKKAYRALLAEYHPDKVSHLGKDLQDLALKKTQDISWAYQQLCK